MDKITKEQILARIDAERRTRNQYDVALKNCSDTFANLFDKFGIDVICLKKAYMGKDPFWGTDVEYRYIVYNRDSSKLSKFEFMMEENETPPLAVLELTDYPSCYNLLAETINANLEGGIPTAEWDKAEKPDFVPVDYHQQSVTEEFGLTKMDAEKFSKHLKIAGRRTQLAMRALLEKYDIPVLYINTPQSSGVDCRWDGGNATRVNYVTIDKNSDYVKYSESGSDFYPNGNYDDSFPYAEILDAMYQAIEYYVSHNIPVSDWGGENDVTRALSKMKVNPSLIKVISDGVEGMVLGRKVRITTVSELRPIGLHLTSFILFEDMNGWLQTNNISIDPDTDEIISNYAVRYHIHSTIACDSIKDIAVLIQHYGISAATPSSMMEELQAALTSAAENRNYKSVIDYASLFEELGIQYTFGPKPSDWECYDNSDDYVPVDCDSDDDDVNDEGADDDEE